jgi:hypothetical protein
MTKNIWLHALVACVLVACGRGSSNQDTTMPPNVAAPDESGDMYEEDIQPVRGTDDDFEQTVPGVKETYPSGSPVQDPDMGPDITPQPDPEDTSLPSDTTPPPSPLPGSGSPIEPETSSPNTTVP